MVATYINLRAVHPIHRRPHLGSSIGSSANTLGEIVSVDSMRYSLVESELPTGCQPKVADFDVVCPISAAADEDILWLQISMDDAQAMDMS